MTTTGLHSANMRAFLRLWWYLCFACDRIDLLRGHFHVRHSPRRPFSTPHLGGEVVLLYGDALGQTTQDSVVNLTAGKRWQLFLKMALDLREASSHASIFLAFK